MASVKEVVERLAQVKGVVGSILVAKDGLVVASNLSVQVQDEIVAAMISAVGGTAVKASEMMGQGKLKNIVLEGEKGKVFLTDSGIGYLGVLTTQDANMGLIRLELMETSEELKKITAGAV
ncbi:hypothetical protein DRQ29_01390 [bacterium]|nr:MAG: hypothetical protein DRQ29_01390 [bacterium]